LLRLGGGAEVALGDDAVDGGVRDRLLVLEALELGLAVGPPLAIDDRVGDRDDDRDLVEATALSP
jgi:hypothetical protein